MGGLAAWALATPVVFWAGAPFFVYADRAARHGTTSMDTLIALGASAAYGYSVWQVLSALSGARADGLLRHRRRDRDADPRR